VEGATIRAAGAAALTDRAGRAVLALPVGPATLRVERIGFRTVEVRTQVQAGGAREVVVELEPEPLAGEEIVVTATRSTRRIEDQPIRVEVVDREEVEEKLLMTPGDVSMLLNETAGLRVQPTAPSLGGASVRIQGLRGRYTLILSDGLPLYGGQSGALGPLQIPPMDLAQVEVIKGAASALYGSTALGGVVNLVSRRPEPERELLLNGTTLGGTDAVLWLADEVGERWGYTLLGGLHRQGRADVDDDGWADLPAFRRLLVRPRLFWNDGRGRSLLATAGGMVEDREGGTMAGALTPGGTPFEEALSTRRADAGVVARALLPGSDRLVALRASASLQDHAHDFGSTTEEDRHATAFAEATLSGSAAAHTWVVGAALQLDDFRSDAFPAFDYRHAVPAAFVQDEWAPAGDVVLSMSARLDAHSEHGAFLNPRLSALFRPGPWSARASVGGGYFAPTPLVEEVEAVGLSRLAAPPVDLDAERAWSGSLDVGRTAGELELNLTGFGSVLHDAVVARPDGEGRFRLENARGPVRAWGAEALVRWEADPFHLTGTYVLTRATEEAGGGGGRREVPLTPRHTAGAVVAWEDGDRGRVGVELYYTGRQALEKNPYRSSSPGYVVFGFLVERRVGPVRLFLNAENLLDARQTRWDPLVLPDRSPEGRWTTDVWGPLEGRVLNGGIRLEL
jgi:outer membrane receptor for ferrienterochelin and colicins